MIVKEDNLWELGEHLSFRNLGKANPKATTFVYRVASRYNNSVLGYVKWYAQWRQYTFFPEQFTILDKKCLTELAEYCNMKTNEHKNRNVLSVGPVTE